MNSVNPQKNQVARLKTFSENTNDRFALTYSTHAFQYVVIQFGPRSKSLFRYGEKNRSWPQAAKVLRWRSAPGGSALWLDGGPLPSTGHHLGFYFFQCGVRTSATINWSIDMNRCKKYISFALNWCAKTFLMYYSRWKVFSFWFFYREVCEICINIEVASL